jgi:hypothetical protein
MEKRVMPRFPVNLSISRVDQQALFGRIKDFSRHGMKVILDTPTLNNKPEIQIEILRPDYNEQIQAIASVVWEKSSEGKCEVGLKFKSIPDEAKVDFLNYGYAEWLKSKNLPVPVF